jgi:hypothetical protein
VLPVLVSFKATPQTDGVWFEWVTGTEINLVGFNLWQALPINGTCQTVVATGFTTLLTEEPVVAKGIAMQGLPLHPYSYDSTLALPNQCYGLELVWATGKSTLYITGNGVEPSWLTVELEQPLKPFNEDNEGTDSTTETSEPMVDFKVTSQADNTIRFEWTTTFETNLKGFRLWQTSPVDGSCRNVTGEEESIIQLTEVEIAAKGQGSSYTFESPLALPNQCYGLEWILTTENGTTIYIVGPGVDKWLKMELPQALLLLIPQLLQQN